MSEISKEIINKPDDEKLKAAREKLACSILPPLGEEDGRHEAAGSGCCGTGEAGALNGDDGRIKLTQMTTAGG